MPQYSMYQMRVLRNSNKPTVVRHLDNHGTRWTKNEHTTMVRMIRVEGKSFEQVADHLGRREDAIEWRVRKLLQQHVDGGATEEEAMKWLNIQAV